MPPKYPKALAPACVVTVATPAEPGAVAVIDPMTGDGPIRRPGKKNRPSVSVMPVIEGPPVSNVRSALALTVIDAPTVGDPSVVAVTYAPVIVEQAVPV